MPSQRSEKKKKISRKKVAIASIKLGGRVLNPLNFGKMVINASRGKGIILPGSNFIGPGNSMGGRVKSIGDALAKKHDEEYAELLKAGFSKRRVYLGFSDADKRLLKNSDIETPEGVATYLGMRSKLLLNQVGFTGRKLKDSEVARKKEKTGRKRGVLSVTPF